MYVETRPTKCLALVAAITIAQRVADLIDRGSRLVHARGVDRFTDANRAVPAVIVAEAVEQIVVAVQPIASATAVELGQQLWMLARGQVGVAHRSLEHRR